MSEVTIKLRDDGPYIVSGKIVLLDADGNEFETKQQTALCRCGRSKNKPLCDGAHRGSFEDKSRA